MNALAREIQEYESNIAALRERIARRKAEVAKMKPNTTQWMQLSSRILDLECMCSHMEQSLHQEREYMKLEVGGYE